MEMTLYELRAAPTPAPSPTSPTTPATPAPHSAATQSLSGASVLLVDDDPDFRRMVCIAFTRTGCTVHEAENGNAALDILANHPVDLVVTDIIMPEADGYEVILRLKAQRSRPPLIAVTGGSLRLRMELPGMARLLGADAAFEKPVDLNALLAEAGRLIAARKTDAAG
ncbi:response regulator [Azospirillum sp. B506]|uniref:response regulator n=1 Tax=Azospirillum sp. B506 TaxID=137721 RepID=UPI000346D794|nr:response regulator [Azospirillum sp. B506]